MIQIHYLVNTICSVVCSIRYNYNTIQQKMYCICIWTALPLALTLTHSHSYTHCLHLHMFTCAQPHSLMFSCIQLQPFVVWPGYHVTTSISLIVLPCLTESRSHASAYIITQHSAISQLKGVGCTGMGIHIDSC